VAAGRFLWLLDPMSSTHNESRLAACPLSGVTGRISAPCQLILRRVGRCVAPLALVGHGRQHTCHGQPPSRGPMKEKQGRRCAPAGSSVAHSILRFGLAMTVPPA